MKKVTTALMSVVLAANGSMLGGCETSTGSGLSGAAVGAGIGALIGSGSGNAGKGALIGAAAGGLTGLIVHDVRARKAREAQQTATEYNYQPAQGEMLTFEEAGVLPSSIQRGTMAEASMQYALLGAGAGIEVVETRVLKRGDEVVAELSSKSFTRNDGTWVSAQQFRVSERLTPGTYTILQTARTAKSSISGTANFLVE